MIENLKFPQFLSFASHSSESRNEFAFKHVEKRKTQNEIPKQQTNADQPPYTDCVGYVSYCFVHLKLIHRAVNVAGKYLCT